MSSQKGENLCQKKLGKRHHSVLCPLSSTGCFSVHVGTNQTAQSFTLQSD